jgi:hypothetical protein
MRPRKRVGKRIAGACFALFENGGRGIKEPCLAASSFRSGARSRARTLACVSYEIGQEPVKPGSLASAGDGCGPRRAWRDGRQFPPNDRSAIATLSDALGPHASACISVLSTIHAAFLDDNADPAGPISFRLTPSPFPSILLDKPSKWGGSTRRYEHGFDL